MTRSAFTYRDLDLLSKSSPSSPLRVISLIDFDAFYAQCEIVRLNLPPTTPLAVQQWNAIIALNYPARNAGLKRGISVDEAKRLCPDVVLQHVATWREGELTWAYRPDVTENMAKDKSALDPYRLSSRKCFKLIKKLLPPEPIQRVEKASVDEVFLDLSVQVHGILLKKFPELEEKSIETFLPIPTLSKPLDWGSDHVADSNQGQSTPDWDEVALSIGAGIVRQVRAEVLRIHKYTCSAGISHNKVLAKLGAGFKKPNQQTVVRSQAIPTFLSAHRITKIRGLGGKLGQQVIDLYGSENIPDMLSISLHSLRTKLGLESGTWVYNVIRGQETSIVTPRTAPQSMLSAKTFIPNIQNFEQALKWLRIFAADLLGRLNELQDEYPRQPTVIAMHHHINGRFGPTRSRQTTIPMGCVIDESAFYTWTKELLRQLCEEGPSWPCASLSVSISGFQDLVQGNQRITSFFSKETDKAQSEPRCMKRKRTPVSSELNEYKDGAYDCPQCNKSITAALVLEHLDWHAAVELQDSVS
ncbi:DNA/RNA polymerase [Pyrenochaeta sp. DS3sAY3a]|nr:DNA/RNA polymerase [Pyrenochaeta sp. DS3sAY3a]